MTYPAIQKPTRRGALRLIAGAIVGLAITRFGSLLAAEDLPHLTDANPSAASLGYTEDSSTVDSSKFPKHKAEQHCANCKFFQVGADTQYAPCQLYPGNAVNANGWCAGYASK